MVDYKGVILPDENGDFHISTENAVVIPAGWLVWHAILKNLEPTQTVQEMAASKRVSHRILADLLTDVSLGMTYSWRDAPWLVYDVKQKQIMAVTNNNVRRDAFMYLKMPEKAKEVKVYAHPRYRTSEGQFYYAKFDEKGLDEARANKIMWDVFRTKFPVKLKSYTPVFGPTDILPKPVVDYRNHFKAQHNCQHKL